MRKLFILGTAAVLINSCTNVTAAQKPVISSLTKEDLPTGAVFTHAWELLSAINTKKKVEIEDFLRANGAASMYGFAGTFLKAVHDTGRLSVVKIEKSESSNEARMQLAGDNLIDMYLNYHVLIDNNQQNKIVRASIQLSEDISDDDKKIKSTEAVTELHGWVKSLCDADVFSGAMILAKDAEVIYANACGEANKDFAVSNTIDTKFGLAAMGKMFTAVAIAQLVQQGKLSFDDPLWKFMPDFLDEKSAKAIKISHLLAHTSGMGASFTKRINASPRARLKPIGDFLASFRRKKLDFEPGTKWHYSNTGYLVLGKIIEIVTKTSYFDYVDKNVYFPAMMFQTGSFDLTKVNATIAIGYDKIFTDKGFYFSNNLFDNVIKGGPAGGGFSTVGDLLKFSLALQHGQLINGNLFDQITTPHPLNEHFGLGFVVRETPGGKSVGYRGMAKGISSELLIFPKKGFTAIVLSNYSVAGHFISLKMKQLIGRIN